MLNTNNRYLLYVVLIWVIICFIFSYGKNSKKGLIVTLIPLFLILCFQIAIGTDYYSYIRIFHHEVIFKYSRGPMFKILIDFLKSTTNNERTMFLMTSSIQILLFYKIIKKLQEEKIIEKTMLFILVMIISTSFYLQCFNILRNSIASLFVELAILYLLEKRRKKSFFLILLGTTFHPSVVIWGIILLMKKFLLKKREILSIFLLFITLFILNKIKFIPNLAQYIYDSGLNIPYRHYLISKHMFPYSKHYGIGTIINIILYTFSLKFYKKETNKNKIFMYNLGYIFYMFSLLFANIPIFTRMLGPKGIFIGYLNYILLKNTLSKRYCYLGIFILIYYILCYLRSVQLILPPV